MCTNDQPVNPTSPMTVILCAESAIDRPLTTILSHADISAALFAACAALNLATFCAGVSMGPEVWFVFGVGALRCDCGCGDLEVAALAAARREVVGFVKAWGEVAVNRVASATERDIAIACNDHESGK